MGSLGIEDIKDICEENKVLARRLSAAYALLRKCVGRGLSVYIEGEIIALLQFADSGKSTQCGCVGVPPEYAHDPGCPKASRKSTEPVKPCIAGDDPCKLGPGHAGKCEPHDSAKECICPKGRYAGVVISECPVHGSAGSLHEALKPHEQKIKDLAQRAKARALAMESATTEVRKREVLAEIRRLLSAPGPGSETDVENVNKAWELASEYLGYAATSEQQEAAGSPSTE